MRLFWTLIYLTSAVPMLNAVAAKAQDAPPAGPPVLFLTAPLVVTGGEPVEVTLLGRGVAGATAVQVSGPAGEVPATIKETNAEVPPNGLSKDRLGDSRVIVTFTPPELTDPADLLIAVTTPAGTSEPRSLRVLRPNRLVRQTDENNSFAKATPFQIGQTLSGAIDGAKDVDVYGFDGKAGQPVTFKVTAARRNSPLDAIVTVYNAAGTVLIEADDRTDLPPDDPARRDPVLTVTPPTDGPYFVVVSDAIEAHHAIYGYYVETAEWAERSR